MLLSTVAGGLTDAGIEHEIHGDAEIGGVVHHTGSVLAGTLFCCVPGSRFDGHDHAEQVVAAGAVALLVERHLPFDVPQLVVQVAVISIANTGGVLAPLSIAFSVSAIVWRSLRKVIYLVPHNARISEAIVSGAGTAQPADTPSATGASVESDTPPAPPAYVGDRADVLEKT